MKKLLLIFLLVIGPVALESCIFNTCGDGDFPEHFDWKDLTLSAYDRNNNNEVSLNQKISFHSVSFLFRIDKILIAHHLSGSCTLMACDPPIPRSVRLIEEIQIVSSKDFISDDKTYSAGSDLGELFYVRDYFIIPEFISNAQPLYNDIDLFLATGPKDEQYHEFTFSFKLDDGQVFEENFALTLTP